VPQYSAVIRGNLDRLEQVEQVGVVDKAAVKVDDVPTIVAQDSTLTTRTSNTVGTLTMTVAAHGIVTGQVVDLYWSPNGKRAGVTVGTVSGTTVPFTGGAGDNLPIATTEIFVGVRVGVDFKVNGTNVTAILLAVPVGFDAIFAWDAAGTAEAVWQYVIGGNPFIWPGINSNILAGVITVKMWMSTDNTVAVCDPQAGVLYH
jgi:hypothetical protein